MSERAKRSSFSVTEDTRRVGVSDAGVHPPPPPSPAASPSATNSWLLTADCVSLVGTVGALGLSVAAPASRDALSVLAGEVGGGAGFLCCRHKRRERREVTSRENTAGSEV